MRIIDWLAGRIDAFGVADGPPPQTLWPFFKWCITGSKKWITIGAVMSSLVGVLEVFSAIIMGVVIDNALASGTDNFWVDNWVVLAASVVFFLAARPIAYGCSAFVISVALAANIYPMVMTRLHRWTLGQNVGFFDNDFAGRIAQKQMQTARAVADSVSEIVNVVFFALASLFGSVLLLTGINGWMAVVLGLWTILYLSAIRWFVPRVREAAKLRANARAGVTGQIVDTITNIKTVKLFAHADHEDRAAIGAISDFRGREIEFKVWSAGFRLAVICLAGILPVLMIGGTLWLWTHDAASTGDIVAAGAIAIRIAQMTGWVGFTVMVIYAYIGEVEDGMHTLTPPHRLAVVDDPQVMDGQGAVEFQNVTFGYGRENGGVQGINLRIAPGEKVGIVGASGAGKSTLVALLLRLYDVEQGQILIGGQNILGVSEEGLRRQIGMVTQDTAMFNRSARDNILYGRPEADAEDVIAAAQAAEAHDFVEGLEDFKKRQGYDAHLGERGVKLSGGQRQRIALARAVLKDAPILVLDEATSALDSEVEAVIQTALEKVTDGKTVLAIAHRLSTIARMDRIVVMDDGRIVEVGTHEELLALDGFYARFWSRQTDGFAA